MTERKIHSNSKKAKGIIRREMLSYFSPKEYGTRSRLLAMKKDADAYNGGRRGRVSNYEKGAGLVDAASLAIYDQDRMLSKIYGKKKVLSWDMEKRHNTYRHLIGREYSAMLQEKDKQKLKKRSKRK